MADGKLIFDTSMDTNGFSNGLKKINSVFAGMTMFKGLELALGAVKNSFEAAFNRMDTADKFKRVMTVMTGDVKIANKALAETTGIVKGTAYGLNVAAQSVQNFVSRGMQVDKATNSIRLWGDAVSFYGDGTNETFASVTDALSKMQTNGKVQMREMQQLFYAGIPALDIYAKATGQSTKEVSAQMQKGKLDSNDFINAMNRAFESGVEGFPKVAGAAKEAGASWAGTFDNMQAAIARGTESMIKNIDRGLRSANLPTIKEMVTNIGKGMETALKVVGNVLGGILKHANVFVPIIGGVKAFSLLLPIATSGLKKLGTETEKGSKLLKMLGIATNSATGSVIKQIMADTSLTTAQKAKAIYTAIVTGAENVQDATTKKLTASTIMLSAAMMALPIIGIISAIVSLVSVMSSWGSESDAVTDQIKADTDATISKYDELKNRMADSSATYRENAADLRYTSDQADYLVGRLTALSGQQEQTAGTAENQRSVTKQLVELYPELTSSVDETTGILNMNDEATAELVNSTIEYVNALKEYELVSGRYNEVSEESADLNIKNMATVEQLKEAEKALAENKDKLTAANEKLETAESKKELASVRSKEVYDEQVKVIEELNSEITGLNSSNKTHESTIKDLTKVLEEQGTSIEEVEAEMKNLEATAKTTYANAKNEVLDFAKGNKTASVDISTDIASVLKDKEKYTEMWTKEDEELLASVQKNVADRILAQEQEVQAVKDGAVKVAEALGEELVIRQANGDELNELETAQLNQYVESKTALEEEYKKHYENLKTYAFNGFEGIKEQTTISMDDIMNNLNAKAQMISVWGNNMSALAKAGLHDGFIQQLKDAGPESAAQTQVIIDTLNQLNGGVDISLGIMTQEAQDYLDQFNGAFDNAAIAADDSAGKISGATGKAGVEASGNFKMDSTQAVSEVQRFSGEIETTLETEFSAEKATLIGNEYGKQIALNIELGFNEGVPSFGGRIGDLMTNMGTSISMGSGGVQAAMSNVMVAVGNAATSGASSVGPGITSMMSNLVMGILSAAPSAATAMMRVMQQAVTAVKTGAGQVKSAIQSMMSQAVSAVVSHAPAMTSAGLSITTAIANGIRNGYGPVYNAGYYVMGGMSAAMTDYTPILYNKAETIANGIATKLKKAFDINSPSRVTYGIFENVMLGMINAMDDKMPILFSRAESIKNGLTKRVKGSGNFALAGAYSSNSNAGVGVASITYNQELNIHGDINDPATLRRRAKDALRLGGMASGK